MFAPALKAHSHSVILVHNHPSGDCSPSKDDMEITRMLRDAAETLGG
ncbi:MAG: JAB domain-containing protein [Elusimicrobiota bacterium]